MSAKTYRHNPTTIRALVWQGTNLEEILDFVDGEVEFIPPSETEKVAQVWNEALQQFIPIPSGTALARTTDGVYYPFSIEALSEDYTEVDENGSRTAESS